MERGARKLTTIALLRTTLGATVCVIVACRSSTQIVWKLYSDVPCTSLRGVAFYAASTPSAAEGHGTPFVTHECRSTVELGTVVTQPEGASDDTVAFRAAVGFMRDARECTSRDDYKGCIVQRRRLRYVAHTSLEVAMVFRARCE